MLRFIALALVSTACSGQTLSTREIAGALSQPVFAAAMPIAETGDPGGAIGSGRLAILELSGRVVLLTNPQGAALSGADPAVRTDPIVELSEIDGFDQVYALAFDPNFRENGRVWMTYRVRDDDARPIMVVASFESVAGSGLRDDWMLDLSSENCVLTYTQAIGGHRAGWLDFGRDRMLYVATGDDGGAFRISDNAQRLDILDGKILRLDVNAEASGSLIPPDNPFADRDAHPEKRPEIWAYGLRNPWRCSFDRQTGDLWIGDVGQNDREEVNVRRFPFNHAQAPNYGWPCREGDIDTPGWSCDHAGPFTEPVHTYATGSGGDCSITGGYVYRGCSMPTLRGRYVFADYCSGRVTAIDALTGMDPADLLLTAGDLVSLAEDVRGELLVINIAAGTVGRLGAEVDACVCHADLDVDGDVDVFDLLRYFGAYRAADGELDARPGTDVFDLLAFFALYRMGCG